MPSSVEQSTVLGQASPHRLFQSHTISVGGSRLRCVSGPHKGLEVPIEKELLVFGRAPWCDVALPQDLQVSRHHCELVLDDGQITLRDLRSGNGTFTGDIRIYEAPLERSFRIGASTFEVCEPEAAQEISVKHYDRSGILVGRSPTMRKLFAMLARLGDVDASVLLLGETGTGKSSVAQALHEQSVYADGPFVTVNCGALSPSLIESSLFGYEKGAFTGADKRHLGFFEQANGGTLFLDEIGELPYELQPKLLDVLERKRLYRLGGKAECEVDFRLVTATHSALAQALEAETFREDLYYRIAVVELEVPPLRERLQDLPLLADYLLHQLAPDAPPQLTPAALSKLQAYHWPGNIRQLRNVLQRSLLFASSALIDEATLSIPWTEQEEGRTPAPASLPEGSYKELLQREEQRILQQFLEAFGWDVSAVSRRLEISRATLYNYMNRLGIKRP